jgi:hypothetical protein
MNLLIERLHQITAQLIAEGHGNAVVVVEDDGGLSDRPNVIWHPRWGDAGQLELVKGAAAIRGTMLHDASK